MHTYDLYTADPSSLAAWVLWRYVNATMSVRDVAAIDVAVGVVVVVALLTTFRVVVNLYRHMRAEIAERGEPQ